MRGKDISEAWQSIASSYQSEAARNDQAATDLERTRATLQDAVTAAAKDLAAVFLPALTPEALTRAEALTGFRGFTRFEPIKAMEKEDARLRTEIASIQADERYARREYLVGPHGDLTRRLEEARGMLAPWEADAGVFEAMDGFLELVEVGYDTPEFALRWWEPRYWRLWAAGDAVCVALNLPDFGDDVLPAWHKVRGPRDQWRTRVAEVEAEVRGVHELVQRHDADQARLQNLGAIYLDECHAALGRHLETADPALIESWSPDDKAVITGARRLAGTKAKVPYHDEMITGLRTQSQGLMAQASKASRKAAKFLSTKRYHVELGDGELPTDTDARLAKVRTGRDKLMVSSARMQTYNRYDGFDLQSNDPALWWIEMTGRRPSPLCPGARAWYDRNPAATCIRDDARDPSGAVASAMADRAHDDLGDLS